MPAPALREIQSFNDLLVYLEEKLDWPLQGYSLEDAAYSYEPAEIGLKEKDAARIKVIRQLRPLVSGQPWGIFFVEFENKKLPVVVLRRILSHLVIKKRASANKASAPAWHAEDLLFVTAFGEDDTQVDNSTREIAFAHFHQTPGDLPTLHVLGWDGGDTPLKLAQVDHVLHERLHWPVDESNANAWREMWSKPFRHRIGHVIQTADLLAEELAKLARGIRDKANRLLTAESERGPLTKLFKAFQTALIHDLTPESFADTYAQTITYGLLTAAISRTEMSEGRFGTFVKADDIADIVPVTNPFLKEMLQTFLKAGGRKGGIDFDELGIQDVVELLRGEETDLPAVIADFGNKNPNEDPVIHFYEHFLAAYDNALRVKRGVFYTPQPVVSYIVRSVHELLQTEFGLEDGLASTITWGEMASLHPSPASGRGAGGEGEFKIPEGTSPDSPFVTILDPATGTATFLVEVISVIYRTLMDKWKKQGMNESQRLKAWNIYVPKHLLPRLYGYELMMAPYAIAHMKIGLKLKETDFAAWEELTDSDRVRIYLTNALEPAHEVQPQLEALAPALAHEAQAVANVKRDMRFTVVLGNPPYSGLSANLTEQARQLVGRFKFIDGVKVRERGALQLEKNLQDDYIKFLAFAEDRLNEASTGICGVICNHGFIDNPTLRGVRWSLFSNFHRIWVLDLHGNVNRGEKTPDDSDDQNVFDIKDAGVAIFIGMKGRRDIATDNQISKGDVWGNRELHKYPFLQSNNCSSHTWETITSEPEFFLFRTLSQHSSSEYNVWPKVTEVFPLHSIGMITARDAYVIDYTAAPVVERAKAFRDSKLDDEATCKALGIPLKKGWNITRARERIKHIKDLTARVQPVLYRPFDVRPVFYHESLIWGMAWPVMQHMVGGKNLALITSRMTKGESFQHVLVSNTLSEVILLSSKTSNNAFVFPLHLRSEASGFQFGEQTNLAPQFLSSLANRLGVMRDEITGLPVGLTPEDIFYYAYAVFHSPGYRSRYAEFLKIDFPRLPLTGNPVLFRALAQFGSELVALHLLESPKVNVFITRFVGEGDNSIPKKPIYKDGVVWINASQRFEGVPEAVWKFHIGGYQVCEKWLKDRKGRILSADDIAHYQRVVVALNETIRLMAEIDRAIETYGGWPGAFQTSADEVAK